VERRTDRRTERQCAEIQGNLARGAGGDCLPAPLETYGLYGSVLIIPFVTLRR
jgi:hypothetical protein